MGTNTNQPLATIDQPTPTPITPPTTDMPPKAQKRRLPFIIMGVFLLLALLVGGTWAWANNAKARYAKAVPAYEASARAAYDYFGQLKDRLSHGADIQRKFDQTIASAPKAPTLLGMALIPADQTQRVADLTSALQKFETTYVRAADISSYSKKALSIMAGVTGIVSSPSDMERIKPKLEEAKTSLAALKPPAPVKDFHNQTLEAYTASLKDIDAALTALSAGETAVYTASIQKLATDIKNTSANTAKKTLESEFSTAYGQADVAYGALQKQLGIE